MLIENRPLQAIMRMNEFDLLQFISPEIVYTPDLEKLLEEVGAVLSWFDLLYLEDAYEKWKVYWYGLTSQLDTNGLRKLAQRMQMNDLESRKMVGQRLEMNKAMDKLQRLRGNDNYGIYTLLSQYDTEILLFMMANTDNERTKRLISNYFTKLKGVNVMLKGKELKEMGFRPGPLYKEILGSLLEARLNNRISTKEDELRFVKDKFEGNLERSSG